MSHKRCCNIDWLEVFVLEDVERYPCNADYYRSYGWHVQERAYGTRIYAEMFTLIDEWGEPFLEVRRAPYSVNKVNEGFFPPNACHIRFHNRTCYMSGCITILRDFLALHNYTFKKIYRLDVCLDFEFFDKGDDPARFIQRYMRGTYAKINQANIGAHGRDQWDGRTWNSLSWGNPKSMVSTKLYNKTLELEQAHDKPYIKQAWRLAGLIDDTVNMTRRADDGSVYKPVIWRVEFSVKSSAQKWFVIERNTGKHGKIPMPHTLDMYDTPSKLLTVFASLASHYFHFKHYEEGVRKDRCRDKVLFDFSPLDTFYKVDRLASHTASSTPLRRLITLLKNYLLANPFTPSRVAILNLIEQFETDILKSMSNKQYTTLEVVALRRVMADRIAGIKDISIQTQLNSIIQTLKDSPNLFI